MYIDSWTGERWYPVNRARRPYKPLILLRSRDSVIREAPVCKLMIYKKLLGRGIWKMRKAMMSARTMAADHRQQQEFETETQTKKRSVGRY
jgi:hypothetical protein